MSRVYAFTEDGRPLVLTGRWHCEKRAVDCPHVADCSIFGCPDTPKRNKDDRHKNLPCMHDGQPVPYLADGSDSKQPLT